MNFWKPPACFLRAGALRRRCAWVGDAEVTAALAFALLAAVKVSLPRRTFEAAALRNFGFFAAAARAFDAEAGDFARDAGDLLFGVLLDIFR